MDAAEPEILGLGMSDFYQVLADSIRLTPQLTQAALMDVLLDVDEDGNASMMAQSMKLIDALFATIEDSNSSRPAAWPIDGRLRTVKRPSLRSLWLWGSELLAPVPSSPLT